MKKNNISLILNILIVILEMVGFSLSIINMHRIGIEYYTEEANLLAMVSSLVFIIYLIRKKEIPKWLSELKYISNINLAITFLVVLFILIPMDNFNFKTYLVSGAMKYHHLICPVMSIVSFIFFDNLGKFNKKDVYIGLVLTIIYAIVMVILNLTNVVIGPYPFLMVRNQTIYMSIIWCISILGFAYLIAIFLKKLYTKINLKVYEKE